MQLSWVHLAYCSETFVASWEPPTESCVVPRVVVQIRLIGFRGGGKRPASGLASNAPVFLTRGRKSCHPLETFLFLSCCYHVTSVGCCSSLLATWCARRIWACRIQSVIRCREWSCGHEKLYVVRCSVPGYGPSKQGSWFVFFEVIPHAGFLRCSRSEHWWGAETVMRMAPTATDMDRHLLVLSHVRSILSFFMTWLQCWQGLLEDWCYFYLCRQVPAQNLGIGSISQLRSPQSLFAAERRHDRSLQEPTGVSYPLPARCSGALLPCRRRRSLFIQWALQAKKWCCGRWQAGASA